VVILIGLVVLALVLFVSQRRRTADMKQRQANLEPGARIMLTSGIFGTVTAITDDGPSVEIAPGVVITVVRAAVGRIIPADEATDDAEAAETSDDTETSDAAETTEAPAAADTVAETHTLAPDSTIDLTDRSKEN
jgi:preprotein translocase subunit YajC